MPRLKSRTRFIPGGFRFYIPETKWGTNEGSFDNIVQNAIMHVQGHPELQAKGWPTDYAAMSERVDAYNATICQRMGWADFFSEGGAPVADIPFPQAVQHQPMDQNKLAAAAVAVKKVWVGIKTLRDWVEAGAPAVQPELAEKRAAVCATCPKNGAGDFTSWFTKPAASSIKRMIEVVQEKKLTTSFDDKLNICEVCLCPMRVKVHPPIEILNQWMGDQDRADLKAVTNPSGGCWIIKEVWPNGQ